MDKNKKKVIILMATGFFLLIGGIIIYVVTSYQDTQNEMKQRMNEISTTYQDFKQKISSFNEKRDAIYQDMMQDMYYQTLQEKDAAFKQTLQEYEQIADEIKKDYQKVETNCKNSLYPDVSINQKCEAFILGYEQTINSFVSDVDLYNQNITAYNTWSQENNQQPLEKYKTKKEYIDVNGDRIYKGKEELKSSGEVKNEKE
mgnify:CR=1 FL=1